MVFVRAIATIQLGYTDADWAGELEKRKSTTGVQISLQWWTSIVWQ
jgi:hypothetical protein